MLIFLAIKPLEPYKNTVYSIWLIWTYINLWYSWMETCERKDQNFIQQVPSYLTFSFDSLVTFVLRLPNK